MAENYAILRFGKVKRGSAIHGIEAHHERLKKTYASNPTIDLSRIKDNYHIIESQNRYRQEIESRISVLNTRIRKDSVVCVDTLITSGPEFFSNRSPEETRAFFKDSCDFIASKVGRQNIISATVHLDEKTPHLHLVFVPITPDGHLSAKDIIGGKMGCVQWQNEFYAFMVKRYSDLSRGKSAEETHRKHITMTELRKSQKMSAIVNEMEFCVSETTPFNVSAQKKKLQKFAQEIAPLGRDLEQTVAAFQTQAQEAEQKAAMATADLAIVAEHNDALEIQMQQLREKAAEEKRILEATIQKLQSECQHWQQRFEKLLRTIRELPSNIKQEIKDFLATKEGKTVIAASESDTNGGLFSMADWKTRIEKERTQAPKLASNKPTQHKNLDRFSR